MPLFRRVTLVVSFCASLVAPAAAAPHNVLIFVADGLRYVSVSPETAPTLARLRHDGVDFTNSHAMYPTITTPNASAIATGHYLGDTGNFGNQLFAGFASPEAGGATTPFLENDAILGEMNAHFEGNYLDETSLLAAARQAGFATAAMGKIGPTAIQDVTARDGTQTIVIDDAIGTPAGIPVSPEIAAAIKTAGIAPTAPKTSIPNVEQQAYLLAIATKVVLPHLKASGKPFVFLFWSRDPDATQHAQKDSLGKLTPGINGPTAKAGIRNADNTLAALLDALKAQGLDKTTDVFATADHGFSTISKESATSAAAKIAYADVPKGELPSGFLAIDVADALALPLFDPNAQKPVDYKSGTHPVAGNGFIGADSASPTAMVVANGGSDFIYLPGPDAKTRAAEIVRMLTEEDYTGAIFVNDTLGDIPGTLPLSAINLRGAALTPQPSIVVSFRSFPVPGCDPLLMCAAEIADTSLGTGQGMHGTFSRADTRNFMAAFGPDFKAAFADKDPVSNADIAPTLASILGLSIVPKGGLTGRVVAEALVGGRPVKVSRKVQASLPAANGLKTILDEQIVGPTVYFDAAGFPGRAVGLEPR
jgi:arylsulfatase A-like enzyme